MSNTQTTPTSGTATGLSVATGSVSVDIAEKIITAIEGRFRDWLMHGEHTEAKELVTDILERELDGWTVKADDYDRLREAAIWLRRSCKDRLPVGHYAKLDEECRAIDAVLSPNEPDEPQAAANPQRKIFPMTHEKGQAGPVGSTGGSALPPSFAILKQALADDAFEGGEVASFGDYSVSWNTRENLVAIADSGGWWTIPVEQLKAIAAATPNNPA